MSNFSSVLIIFHPFFTWISLGDIDFCFSPMLVRKANAFEEESKFESHDYITNVVIISYTWLMVWQWHHSLLAYYRR